MKKMVTLVMAILAIYFSGFAQEPKHNRVGLFITYPVEFTLIDAIEVNEKLAAENSHELTYPKFAFGYGLQLYLHGFVFSGSYVNRKKKVENPASNSSYRALAFNMGFAVVHENRFSLYPFVGYKHTKLYYGFPEFPKALFFENRIQKKYNNISHARSHLNLGIGLSHHWFHLLDLKFGYLLPIGGEEFVRVRNSIHPDAPAIHYNFYFTLTAGLGKIGSRKK